MQTKTIQLIPLDEQEIKDLCTQVPEKPIHQSQLKKFSAAALWNIQKGKKAVKLRNYSLPY